MTTPDASVGDVTVPPVQADDFARRFSVRSANMMWFLGAGASAAAGIPTATDLIWEFKQLLFASQRKVSPQSVQDLASTAIREQLQEHIDALGSLPKLGDPTEYAALFEAAYPAEADRRAFLDAKMSGAKPSYGHLALASLMKADKARLVWTTNFDPLIADACAKVYDSTGRLTTASLDAPELAPQAIASGRWPVEVKLHGDFRSRRLKNTNDELRQQDQRLRSELVQTSTRFGLIVVGYSGRDDSIMDTLDQAVGHDGAFPSGVFWLHRGDSPPLPRVRRFLERAIKPNREVGIVSVESFDEVMRDLLRLLSGVDTTALESFAKARRRWTAAPTPSGRFGWPVLRLNVIPVVQSPTVCRRIVCQIGGYNEVRAAISTAQSNVIAARTRTGVLLFGSDTEARKTFGAHNIELFDLHSFELSKLRYDSGERGLLRDSLSRAITRSIGMTLIRRRTVDLLLPSSPMDAKWKALADIVGSLHGSVRDSELGWAEGIATRLEWAGERLWLQFDPRTVFIGLGPENKALAADFGRERTVKRYNKQLNELIDFWANLLANGGIEMRTLGIADGVDATFSLSSSTGFSRRAGA